MVQVAKVLPRTVRCDNVQWWARRPVLPRRSHYRAWVHRYFAVGYGVTEGLSATPSPPRSGFVGGFPVAAAVSGIELPFPTIT